MHGEHASREGARVDRGYRGGFLGTLLGTRVRGYLSRFFSRFVLILLRRRFARVGQRKARLERHRHRRVRLDVPPGARRPVQQRARAAWQRARRFQVSLQRKLRLRPRPFATSAQIEYCLGVDVDEREPFGVRLHRPSLAGCVGTRVGTPLGTFQFIQPRELFWNLRHGPVVKSQRQRRGGASVVEMNR